MKIVEALSTLNKGITRDEIMHNKRTFPELMYK